VPRFHADTADCDLEERIEALRRELAALVIALSKASQELADLAEELHSRRHANKVVALERRPRRECSRRRDILGDFLE
jgi:uncharacterized membrane protein